MDTRKLRIQINDQLDAITGQAAALRFDQVTNRQAAVALLVSNVDTLAAWEAQLRNAEEGAGAPEHDKD